MKVKVKANYIPHRFVLELVSMIEDTKQEAYQETTLSSSNPTPADIFMTATWRANEVKPIRFAARYEKNGIFLSIELPRYTLAAYIAPGWQRMDSDQLRNEVLLATWNVRAEA